MRVFQTTSHQGRSSYEGVRSRGSVDITCRERSRYFMFRTSKFYCRLQKRFPIMR